MAEHINGRRDIWLESGVVWAAAEGELNDSAHQNLTQRAVALAAKEAKWRLLFDYRRATLTHDVLALSRHAELMSRLGLPESTRTAMLCRQRSSNFVFWERVLRARGHVASVFTDGAAALSWLQRPAPGDAATLTDDDASAGKAALVDVESLKRMLREFAAERADAPRGQVTAEFTALIECLFAQADQLGIDLMQGTEIEARRPGHCAPN